MRTPFLGQNVAASDSVKAKMNYPNARHLLDPHAGFGILNLPAEVAE